MMSRNFSIVAVVFIAATPVLSQDAESLCGITSASAREGVASELEGNWTTDFKAGYVVAGPMVMPHPAAPAPETGRLEVRDQGLTIVPDNPEGLVLPLEWEAEASWSFDREPSLPGGATASNVPDLDIDDDDLATIAGCPVNDLPRLVGVGSVDSQGVSMTFTVRMMVVNEGLIYGFQQVDGTMRGQTVVERRPFVMSR